MYVPFDKDWYDLGFLEPEFIEERYGYANERILIEEGAIEATMLGDEIPTYIPSRREACSPIPLYRLVLRWRLLAPLPKKAGAVVR